MAEARLAPAPVPRLAEAPFLPAPVPVPWVGIADAQSMPVIVPGSRVKTIVTLPAHAPLPVPRVHEPAEVQLAPAPTPARRVKAASTKLVPAPVSVPRVWMAGVRPDPVPVPAPRRRAAKSQLSAQSVALLPAHPSSLQPPSQPPLYLACSSLVHSFQLLTLP